MTVQDHLPLAHRAMQRIEAQVALGPRHVGAVGHRGAQELLAEWLESCADELHVHAFDAKFFGQTATVRNLWAHFEGTQAGRILLGTHYDTRPWADLDPDAASRRQPVPGANDGGSGVAVLAEWAQSLCQRRERPHVDVVFFDAEDWHGIDGKEVSLGARRFVDEVVLDGGGDGAQQPLVPTEVTILDMIGGKNLMLDVDASCANYAPSLAHTKTVFDLGREAQLPCFALDKPEPHKWITCDHAPFMEAGFPTALLIDLDYPQWHTTTDLPEACAPESLAQMATFLEAYVFGHRR